MSLRRLPGVVSVAAVLLCCARAPSNPSYMPRARPVTITTVPLLVKEARALYPFLADAFARGGVLDGKEVYAFIPGTITVFAGDTLRLTFLNPEDDAHSFALHGLYVPLPPQSRTDAVYVAREPGVFGFSCTVPQHVPMMHGELVVLRP